jgi:hypothetical protein
MRLLICAILVSIAAITTADLPWTPQETIVPNAVDDNTTPGYLPDVEVAPNGTAIASWVVWWRQLNLMKVHTARSTDSGRTWGPAMQLPAQWVSRTPNEPFHSQLATDNKGNWMVIYYSGTYTNVGYSRSTDDGITWTPAAPLDNNLLALSQGQATLAADDNGNFIVAFAPIYGGLYIARWDHEQSKFIVSSPDFSPAPYSNYAILPDLGRTTPVTGCSRGAPAKL